MWTCLECGEQMEDQFDSCWKCAGRAREKKPGRSPGPNRSAMQCLRCEEDLKYLGAKHIDGDGLLDELADLLRGTSRLYAYACPACGHVEFFVDAPGEALERSDT